MKQTVKSCSCQQCKLSGIKTKQRKAEQRAARHAEKISLRLGRDVWAAHRGDYKS